jgi:hypothetical protein
MRKKSTSSVAVNIIRKEGIEEVIGHGFRSTEEIKWFTRAGMGPCQGWTCRLLVAQIIN